MKSGLLYSPESLRAIEIDHMERDLKISGNILFSTIGARKLQTIDVNKTLSTVWDFQTDVIWRFTQMNESVIAVVLDGYSCIKTVDRNAISGTSPITLAGDCGTAGYKDGSHSEAQFSFIKHMIHSINSDSLMVLEYYNLVNVALTLRYVTLR